MISSASSRSWFLPAIFFFTHCSFSMISLLLLLFLSLSEHASAQSKYQKSPEQRGGNEIIPGRYIVEFSKDGKLRAQANVCILSLSVCC